MQTLNKYLLYVCTGAAIAGFKDSAGAAAFDLPDQDAFVIGRGMAFVATADNPSAIYYNPAGITQLSGSNVRGGMVGLGLFDKVRQRTYRLTPAGLSAAPTPRPAG